jgi:hypothetical protein
MAKPNPKDELVEELAPFVTDFSYYAPRILKIRAKTGRIEPFVFNAAQKLIHEALEAQKKRTGKVRALVLKGRQQGASTYVGGRFYHATSTDFGKQALILTHLQDSTDALFDMTKRYHEQCVPELQPATSAASAKELAFAELDSGYIVATAGSKAVGRGRTIQFFHGSEVAFWANAEDHLAGLGQAIPDAAGTEVVLESTANGVGNLFHRMCMDALKGIGDYILIFVPWFLQPEYQTPVPDDFSLTSDEAEYARQFGLNDAQSYWRRRKIRDDFRGDVALFDQEYPGSVNLAFRRVSGNPLIDGDLVAKAREPKTNPPEALGPRLMGVDPAEYGDDASAIACRQGRVVDPIIRYHKRGPMELAGLVAIKADQWKPDHILVDCTGVGSGVADRLIELGYPVTRVHFGSKPLRDELYVLRRDELWGEMKTWFEDQPNTLPQDDALEADLTAPQYTYDSSRRLKLESKEQMRKRGISSPDSGDALALTFGNPFGVNAKKAAGFKATRTANRDWRAG